MKIMNFAQIMFYWTCYARWGFLSEIMNVEAEKSINISSVAPHRRPVSFCSVRRMIFFFFLLFIGPSMCFAAFQRNMSRLPSVSLYWSPVFFFNSFFLYWYSYLFHFVLVHLNITYSMLIYSYTRILFDLFDTC